MRKTIGLIALLVSSAAVLVSPALARDRDDDYNHQSRGSQNYSYQNYNPGYNNYSSYYNGNTYARHMARRVNGWSHDRDSWHRH